MRTLRAALLAASAAVACNSSYSEEFSSDKADQFDSPVFKITLDQEQPTAEIPFACIEDACTLAVEFAPTGPRAEEPIGPNLTVQLLPAEGAEPPEPIEFFETPDEEPSDEEPAEETPSEEMPSDEAPEDEAPEDEEPERLFEKASRISGGEHRVLVTLGENYSHASVTVHVRHPTAELNKARLEAAALLPKRERTESGFFLYAGPFGRVGRSEIIGGSSSQLDPFRLQRVDGVLSTIPGENGVDGAYPLLEILHSHPDSSAPSFSGGRGTGDVFLAESLNVNVSITFKRELRLYEPQGLDIGQRFRQKRGEFICSRCF